MDPQHSRPRTPSLLVDPAPPTDADDASSPIPGRQAGAGAARPRWLAVAIVVALVAVVAVGALVYNGRVGQHGAEPATIGANAPATTGSVAEYATVTSDSPRDVAVIVPQAGQSGAGVAAGRRDDLAGALPTTTASAPSVARIEGAAPGPAGAALAASLPPEAATPSQRPKASTAPGAHPPRRTRAVRAKAPDSDVALLTALIAHVESGGPNGWQKTLAPGADPQALEMQRCPAANTKAGMTCREHVCAGHLGKSPSCPAPAAKD